VRDDAESRDKNELDVTNGRSELFIIYFTAQLKYVTIPLYDCDISQCSQSYEVLF